MWGGHILEAVAYLHSMGVVHQDIKSSNILTFPTKAAKLCDFGLAKQGSDVMIVDRYCVCLVQYASAHTLARRSIVVVYVCGIILVYVCTFASLLDRFSANRKLCYTKSRCLSPQ